MDTINTWPGWQCVRQLGSGAFGKVYEIRREEFGKEYTAALKVIEIPQNEADITSAYGDGMDQQSATEYFRSVVEDITEEFALMSEMKGYTNIVSYEDHMVVERQDRIGWTILIRMELLTPLQAYCVAHPLHEEDVIHLGCDICRALEICQEKNIIHRDIKPENIFVNAHGDFKLGDFGIARTVEKTVSNLSRKGTYAYMAPEIYRGMPYGAAVDIYSLGIVLYRYLNNNRTPFLPLDTVRYHDREEAMMRRMSGEQIPEPVNGSEALKAAVLKAVAFDPERRYHISAAHVAGSVCDRARPGGCHSL
jgi:serine/threonine-protein kinase